MTDKADEILEYWLGPEAGRDAPEPELRRRWFEKSEATDNELRERYGQLVEQAARGEHDAWAQTPRGRLALVILLDQLTRNLQRGSGRMFENDDKALSLALAGIDAGEDRELRAYERQFLYMPLMHAEQLAAQDRCCELFAALARAHPGADSTRWADQHRAIIARFGRFPHRNALLGRQSTAEEEAFLAQPGSSF
jgi:uncharacterized protein (DUF924 family)